MLKFEIIEASADGNKKQIKCSGMAYSGGTLKVGWGHPVVVDLAGMQIPKNVPYLTDHTNSVATKIGDVAASVKDHKLYYDGEIVSESELAKEVITQAKNGGKWQNSIKANPTKYRYVEEKETVNANGQTFNGPIWYVEKSDLVEISVVAIGADDKTQMAISASFNLGEEPMPKPITAAGNESAENQNLSTSNAQVTSVDENAIKSIAETAASNVLIQAQKQEEERIKEINALFSEDYPEIKAKCISEKKSIEASKDAYIDAQKAERPTLNIIASKGSDMSMPVIEAAALVGLGKSQDSLLKHGYKAEQIEAAHKQFKNGASLTQVLLIAASYAGYTLPAYAGVKGREKEILQAAFSTNAIGGILSNIANKSMLDAFLYVDSAWEKIASVRAVKDFKRYTNYRLTGDLEFKEITNGGEIESGSLGEETFGNQAKALGRLLSITYQDIVNDDLSALDKASALLGRGAALGINKAFWTQFLDNATFCSAANKNLVTANALSIDGVSKAEEAFVDQTDSEGNPLGISPKYLIVPAKLSVLASQIYKDTHIENIEAKKTATTGNPHTGKYEPISSPYLNNKNIAGGSADDWYMIADPRALSVIEIAFLHGQRTPTIETASVDFTRLGIQMRGFFGFGVEKQDPRAIIKSEKIGE